MIVFDGNMKRFKMAINYCVRRNNLYLCEGCGISYLTISMCNTLTMYYKKQWVKHDVSTLRNGYDEEVDNIIQNSIHILVLLI